MGVPLLLLPGAGLPAHLAYPELLETLGDEVEPVLKDLELFAEEDPPAGYDLDVEVAAVMATADTAGLDRFHLLGYSAGGAVSLAVAAAHPDRLLSLALIEPAWAGNEGLEPEERELWQQFHDIMRLPPPDRMAEFTRLHLRPGVEPPPREPGPGPPWLARRPRGLQVLVQAFANHRLDLAALGGLRGPVYIALGGRNNPDYFARETARLAEIFPDCEVEIYEERHHFDTPQHAEPQRLAAALRRLWGRAGS